ncbi:arginine repressor [Legionella micdadei]|uniref:Arginine repressor n=1 Tax=Legionella micdadei TaxID=451 RepID=A0A098GBN7_LEGMI|nr:ArgR family transcriptional regulator [Legionella micdadei]ARG98413.1 ArgR family transcriptional regulator [Legionella micdadei]ARH01163.1 ArgR family transcriptional regulator [Legionella micdadei]KTD30380.1 arginine repressor ArgR [Legionella micdadei]NSL18345.1 ArgR family transcriptional regulator [Legionella micdadei]CEG59904.1 Arginine repressor [Legionella micdadei]
MSYDNVLDGHILSIVQTQEILEQVDLQNKLKERGYDIPQATLSRRLKKLKIAKVAGVYRVVDLTMPSLPLVLNLQISDSGIVVLHTHPGSASSLGSFIDRKYVSFSPQSGSKSGILGTIAGDDTVILIMRSKADIGSLLSILQEEFPYLKIEV